VYGDGEREGLCLPVGSFLCMAGGRDRCLYTGSGKLAAQPVCECPPGRVGRYCERRAGLEPRNPETNITAVDSNDLTVKYEETLDTKENTMQITEINAVNEDMVERNESIVENVDTNKPSTVEENETKESTASVIRKRIKKKQEKKKQEKISMKKSLYPVVTPHKSLPVRAIHRDLEQNEGGLITLGEGLLA